MIKILIGIILFSIFVFLAGIHFYWGMGGKWGATGAVPTNRKGQFVLHPQRSHCFLIGTLLLCPAVFVMIKSTILKVDLPGLILSSGCWIIAVVFIMRAIGEFKYVGFFKKIKGSDFSRLDSRYFSPLCLLIGILSIALAL